MDKFMVVSNRDIHNAQSFDNPEELEEYLTGFGDYNGIHSILFPFWSWKIPDHILKRYRCYGMHTGFLLDGKGKGGSPFDNLQALKVKWAALNVFRMNSEFDNGQVRLAIPMNIECTKKEFIDMVDECIPDILNFLKQDISMVPERFQRLPNVK